MILSIIDNIENSNIGNIIIFEMNNPKKLTYKNEKGSDTATGTEPFSSMRK